MASGSSASPMPRPAQRPDERLAAETPRLQGKLAYGEVRLLLAGARLAEGYAPDLHHRPMGAGVIGLASHLARLAPLRRCSGQENLLLP
jgi:hypothetical protein